MGEDDDISFSREDEPDSRRDIGQTEGKLSSDRPDSAGRLPERERPAPDVKASKPPVLRHVSQTLSAVGNRLGAYMWDRALSTEASCADDQLEDGSIGPLNGRGMLFGGVVSEPDIEFDFVRNDSVVDTTALPPQKFSMAEVAKGGRLQGVISTSSGDVITSRSPAGLPMGVWGGENVLGKNIKIIEVSNGLSGTVGIRIAFDQLQEGKPIIVSAGELSGCSMVYAVDDNSFYAYHTGQKPGDEDWATSREGAASLYQAHVSLTGRSLPGVEVKDGVFVDTLEARARDNDNLIDMISTYLRGTINYIGKKTSDGRDTTTRAAFDNVNQFNYNLAKGRSDTPMAGRAGIAYALLVKRNGRVKVVTYSEDMSIEYKHSEYRFKTLASSEFTLKEFFSARKLSQQILDLSLFLPGSSAGQRDAG